MATLQQIYGIIQPQNPVMGRVVGALLKAAWAVLAESDQTENHTNRLALARKVVADPKVYEAKAWRLFLANATVQAAIDDLSALADNDILYVVQTQQYDTLANMEA
jgi:hypothetical protein